MPVVVTGADTPLGALVIDRLVGAGLDLRATVEAREVRLRSERGWRVGGWGREGIDANHVVWTTPRLIE